MRIFIVDDQELERFHMKVLFKHCSNVTVVGESNNVEDAAQAINQLKPDAIFLDINLGRESGFDLLPRLTVRPKIIFVTLYDEFAVRAFQVNALDYLMKPVTIDRLNETLKRIDQSVIPEPHEPQLQDEPLNTNDRVLLRSDKRQALLPLEQIAVIESDGDYTHVHTLFEGIFIMRRTMKEWRNKLPDDLFSSLDRKLIINTTLLKEIKRTSPTSGHLFITNLTESFEIGKTALKTAKDLLKCKSL